MGNSSTKEQRPSGATAVPAHTVERMRQPHSRSVSESSAPPPQPGGSAPPGVTIDSRRGRSSRPDLSVLAGIAHGSDRESLTAVETRRETKPERDARRLERERANRVKERERSMKDESVDGGFLVTQGVYIGTEDFDKAVVRRLMIERRLSPFFKGLNEHSTSWRDGQLVAAVRGQPIPVDDPSPTTLSSAPTLSLPGTNQPPTYSTANVSSSRSPSFTSDSSANLSPSSPTAAAAHASAGSPWLQTASATPSFRPRSKTLASLTGRARNHSQDESISPEIQLPASQPLHGRPLEAILYRDVTECPICFLYYPPHLNRTRCCDQPICSECFVQIKRPNPHPPEHAELPDHLPATSDSRRRGGGGGGAGAGAGDGSDDDHGGENVLISEPATCPFCVQSDFGVTYDPPPFRSGLTYANHRPMHATSNPHSAMSSSSSLASFGMPGHGSSFTAASAMTRRRTASISASSPAVITTDGIRPDWSQKLAYARAHAARRSAAATALHTAAYLMGGFSGEGRSFAGFGRRSRLVRTPRPDGTTNTSPLFSSLLRDRESSASEPRARGSERDEPSAGQVISTEGSSNTVQGRSGPSSRRRRLEDLEEMMMIEAIRMSLAEEEDRKRREEARAAADVTTDHGPHHPIDTSIAAEHHHLSGRHGQGTDDASPPPGAAGKSKAVDRGSSSPMSPSTTDLTPSHPNDHSRRLSDADRNPSEVAPTRGSTSPGPGPPIPSDQAEWKGAMSPPSLETGPSTDGLVLPNQVERTSDPSAAGGSAETKFSFGSLTAMIETDGDADDDRLLSPLDGSTAQLRGH